MVILFLFAIITFIGSFIQGCTGFGSAIFAMPLLVLIIPLKTATISLLILNFIMSLQLSWQQRKHIRIKIILPTVIGAILGRTLGLQLLINIESSVLKVVLGYTLILFSVYFAFFSNKIRVKPTIANGVSTGILSGVFGGIYNMGGPPQAVYYFSATTDKNEYFACKQSTNTITTAYSILLHLYYGNINTEIIKFSAAGVIAVLAGSYLGMKAFNRIDRNKLAKAIALLMVVMGVMLIVK